MGIAHRLFFRWTWFRWMGKKNEKFIKIGRKNTASFTAKHCCDQNPGYI
ncbi:Hypothetical protein Minf_0983 [Methylacidiphilum infernorum V4]|uniref:Uncharacterized protein n=1 Tax=Methylacidiphilum infernorum (isolate V4) TaxID=481448 RepID=B3DUN5_METI4|nr:Hypothetical protein Minf_0983 [Methylacidiphilum infernorum V4]